AWRTALVTLLDGSENSALPERATRVIAQLRGTEVPALEGLADDCLGMRLTGSQHGAGAVYRRVTAGVFHLPGLGPAGACTSPVATAGAVPGVRFGSRYRRGHRDRPRDRGALHALPAVRHRLEPRARRVHQLRRVGPAGAARDRGWHRSGEGGD